MGMITVAIKGRKETNPTEVTTHRIESINVDSDGDIVMPKIGDTDGVIVLDEPDRFMGIVNTFDWGGD